MSTQIGVAAVGDVLNVNTWSNIPYYFYEAGERAAIFSQPWRFDPRTLRLDRAFWNLCRLITLQGRGGYQYSARFLDKAEASIDPSYFSSTIISFNQLFPRAESVRKAGGKIYYYIDATLQELFKAEVYKIQIPDRMKDIAIKQETNNYRKANGVVSMGRWIHPSLTDFYKVDQSRLFQILPGANIKVPSDYHFPVADGRPGIQRELVLGFVGKDWQRKGLPLLLDVRKNLEALGIRSRVKVIGPVPPRIEKSEGIEYTGFIDKQSNAERFLREVSACDFGCLFSSSEALGISTLEFLRLGVPVAGFYHQGLIDTLLEGASVRFTPLARANEIAHTLAMIVRDENKMNSMKREAMKLSSTVTWEACLANWIPIIHG